MRELRDIPNRAGYIFIGITKDGTQHQCEVYKDDKGLHRVKGAKFTDLAGWERITQQIKGMER